LAVAGTTIKFSPIAAIPRYHEGLRTPGMPPLVANLRAQIKAVDGSLIATSNYHDSRPACLTAQSAGQTFDRKPMALLTPRSARRGSGGRE